jgi:hypothetical protein
MCETDVGDPMHITVAIVSNSNPMVSAPVTVTAVNSIVSGSLYYWAITGVPRILRIDANTAGVIDPLQSTSCVGCHTVSRDGRRMSSSIGFSNLSSVPAPPPTGMPFGSTGLRSSSFNPDASRALGVFGARGVTNGPMTLFDSTGTIVTTASGLPTNASEVEWSPDGMNVAYTSGFNLQIMPALGGDLFGAARTIHSVDPSSPSGRDWWPTWSPDSRRIIFNIGMNPQVGAGSLSMISADGGTPVSLDRANAGAASNYRAEYSPFDSGGYQWVVFSSRRNYGVPQLGADLTVKRLWVTAVRSGTTVTSDPSSVPYYLPGQEVGTNFSAYWVVSPCLTRGERCGASADCCGGNCVMGTTTDGVCMPATTCHPLGDTCGADDDCCSGLACSPQHVCIPVSNPPHP